MASVRVNRIRANTTSRAPTIGVKRAAQAARDASYNASRVSVRAKDDDPHLRREHERAAKLNRTAAQRLERSGLTREAKVHARQADKHENAVKQLMKGKKGGTYYVSAGGKKVYTKKGS